MFMATAGHQHDRKQEILSAAEKVFNACGYSTTTMDAVASQAGISKGSIYNYFQNKQDLFTQLCTELLAGDEAETDRLVSEPISALEKLHIFLDNWFARMKDYIRIGRLMLESWAAAAREEHKGELAAMFRGLYSRRRKRIAAVLNQGLRNGEFVRHIDPHAAAWLFTAVVDGLTVQAILDVGINVDKPFLAALKKGLLTGLVAEND